MSEYNSSSTWVMPCDLGSKLNLWKKAPYDLALSTASGWRSIPYIYLLHISKTTYRYISILMCKSLILQYICMHHTVYIIIEELYDRVKVDRNKLEMDRDNNQASSLRVW